MYETTSKVIFKRTAPGLNPSNEKSFNNWSNNRIDATDVIFNSNASLIIAWLLASNSNNNYFKQVFHDLAGIEGLEELFLRA